MKKTIYILFFFTTILFAACDYDPNEDVDYISPKATIEVDSVEVARGESVNLKALIKDPSGISYASLSYAEWNVSNEIKFEEGQYPREYSFDQAVQIPENAKLEWEEDFVKNDGTRFKIQQQYHKLALTCYDGVLNRNIYYFYIKAK